MVKETPGSEVKKFKCESLVIDDEFDSINCIRVSFIDNPGPSEMDYNPDLLSLHQYEELLINRYYDFFNLEKLEPIVVCTFLKVTSPASASIEGLTLNTIILDKNFDITDNDLVSDLSNSNEELKNLINQSQGSIYCITLYKLTPMSEKLKFTMLTTK